MLEVSINYVAVLVCAVLSMIIGAIWYSPILFGNMWMKAVGIDPTKLDKKKQMSEGMKVMGIHFVFLLISMFVLAHFAKYSGATDLVSGLTLGFWVWLGFLVTSLYPAYSYENRSLVSYGLLLGYDLVCFLISGAILAMWV